MASASPNEHFAIGGKGDAKLGAARHLSDVANNAGGTTSYLMAFASRLFDKFDKNLNGLISLDEFQQSLREMNIDISDEDTLTLFNRFETRQRDGTIEETSR